MSSGVFSTIAVAIDFARAGADGDAATIRRIELEPGHFAYITVATEDALRLAVRLAAGGRVRLVHATPPLMHIMGPADAYFPSDTAARFQQMALAEATAILKRLGELYCTGVEVEIHVVDGPPARVILSDARKRATDAIVLVVSGHRRLHRAFLGSTADKVIRRAHCPVIVMPQPVVED
jgi:nucleotide-binding universal stress UspA family protein